VQLESIDPDRGQELRPVRRSQDERWERAAPSFMPAKGVWGDAHNRPCPPNNL